MDFDFLAQRAPDYVRTTLALHGEAGRRWLSRLTDVISACERRWGIQVGAPFPGLSYNFVAPATLEDGAPAVLKLCVPNHELATEIDALRHFDGNGSARLLAVDEASGALLLERLRPGMPLRALADDAAATSAAVGVMRRLWRPAPPDHRFPTVERWGKGFERLRARFGRGGPFPPALVDHAEALFADLLATSAPATVLHGDLHHWNVLAAEREPWLAIDPKGVVGEPAYEVGALLRNPMPDVARWPDLDRVMARRIDQLADELGFDRERVRGWGLAQAVLSAWWCVEDGVPGWEEAIRCAAVLGGIGR